MTVITFERVITPFESSKHCIILQGRDGKDYSEYFEDYRKVLLITPKGQKYIADVQDYYFKNKFIKGFNCNYPGDSTKSFTFEQSANPGHWVRMEFDTEASLEDGAFPIKAEVFVKTSR